MMSTFAALRDVETLMSYCQGISLEYPRKSLVSLAKRVAPDNVEGHRQRMHRALHRGRFSKDEVFGRLQETLWKSGSRPSSFCIDDTGFAKKGELSVGVHRQYSGTLGKIGNCQVAMSLHVALNAGSVCTDAQLYLPEAWATDQSRRLQAGVPTDVQFQSKWQLAISMLQRAVEGGAPSLPVLADAGYGDSRDFRDAVRTLGLHYCVGISSNTNVWPVGSTPSVPPKTGRGGRPWRRAIDPSGARPVRVSSIAEQAYNDSRFRNDGERFYVAFSLDCCDRETMGYVAEKHALSGQHIRDLMALALDARFPGQQRVPAPIQWLSDNGHCYTAHETRTFGSMLGLTVCNTPPYSPQSNGMAEAFVKTFKRDYVYVNRLDTAGLVFDQLAVWFTDYNEHHRHKGLRMMSPNEYRRLPLSE